MFYVMKRARVADCKVGDRVMVLSDFPGGGIEAGAKGTVSEVSDTNVMVTWDHKNRFGDGFGADELEFLAFGTETYPVEAAV